MSSDYSQPTRALSGGYTTRFVLTAADDSQVLIAALQKIGMSGGAEAPRYHAIHVQKLMVIVMGGSPGVTWRFGNSAPNETFITADLDMSTAGVVFEFDYFPQGVRLAPGRPLQVFMSAPGASADVYVKGFQEMTRDLI